MNKLNDFIEIFGLNINAGDVVKDKHGNEYKLSREYKKQYHGHEDDDINDEELKIVSFTSLEWFKNDFEGCMKKQDIIANKLEKIFKIKKEVHDIVDFSHLYGPGCNWRPIIFEYPIKANTASVLCYHYGDNPEEDNLKIAIHTRKYADFITVD